MLLLLLCQAERKELVMNDRDIIDNFIKLLPLWHYKVERPIKRTQKHSQISYETHYCLIALAKKGPMIYCKLQRWKSYLEFRWQILFDSGVWILYQLYYSRDDGDI